MGSGIAQAAAQSGFTTILYEPVPAVLENAKNNIRKSLANLVTKEKITSAAEAEISGRIHFTSGIQDCRADMVIEAIIENAEAKISLFRQLESAHRRQAVQKDRPVAHKAHAPAQA